MTPWRRVPWDELATGKEILGIILVYGAGELDIAPAVGSCLDRVLQAGGPIDQ